MVKQNAFTLIPFSFFAKSKAWTLVESNLYNVGKTGNCVKQQ